MVFGDAGAGGGSGGSINDSGIEGCLQSAALPGPKGGVGEA
jgi:hypothetical protein